MPELTNLSQLNELQEQAIDTAINSTTSNMSKIVSALTKNLFQQLKPLIYIILAIIIIYIIFKLYSFIKNSIREKRIKLTYYNTEKILAKLENIEKKLGIRDKEQTEKEHEEKKIEPAKEKKTKK